MFDAADAENGDIGGMSVTAAPAETRPAAAAPLPALGGISSKLVQETGTNGAAEDGSLIGLNMSATSESFYTSSPSCSTTTLLQNTTTI